MVTRRNQPRQPGQLNKPAAATFQALRVPHVGTPRESNPGGPARQLAAALGNFSEGLQRMTAGLSSYRSEQEELSKQHDLLTAMAEGEFSSEARHGAHVATGQDPLLDGIYNASQAKERLDPVLDQKQRDFLVEQEANGWAVRVGPEGEVDAGDGTELPPGAIKKILTPEDVDAAFQQQAQSMLAPFEGTDPDKRAIRQYLGRKLEGMREQQLEALDMHRRKERAQKLDTVLTSEAPDMAKSLVMLSPDEAVDLFTRRGLKLKDDMNADLSDRDHVLGTSLESLKANLQDNPSDIELARASLHLLKGKLGSTGQTFMTHDKFRSDARQIAKLSTNILAHAQRDALEQDMTLTILKASAEGKDVNTIGLKDLEVPTAGKEKLKVTVKDALEAAATARDNNVLRAPGGQPRELSVPQQAKALVFSQAGSGLRSPMIKKYFKEFSLDPQNIEMHYELFKSLEAIDPMGIDDYITDADDRKTLTAVSLLAETGMPLQEAAEHVQRYESQGTENNVLAKMSGVKRTWSGQTDIPQTLQDEVFKVFNIIHSTSTAKLSEEDVLNKLDAIGERFMARVPTIYGRPTKVPRGEIPQQWQEKMELFREGSGYFEHLGVNPEEISLIYDGQGYALYDDDGTRIVDPKGKAAYIPAFKVEEYYRLQQKTLALKAQQRELEDGPMMDYVAEKDMETFLKSKGYKPQGVEKRSWKKADEINAIMLRERTEKYQRELDAARDFSLAP